MAFTQNALTLEFKEDVGWLISQGVTKNYKELAKTLSWSESSMYAVMNGKRNVPFEIAQIFYDVSSHFLEGKVKSAMDDVKSEIKIDQQYTLIDLDAKLRVITSTLIELKAIITKEDPAKITAEIDKAVDDVRKIIGYKKLSAIENKAEDIQNLAVRARRIVEYSAKIGSGPSLEHNTKTGEYYKVNKSDNEFFEHTDFVLLGSIRCNCGKLMVGGYSSDKGYYRCPDHKPEISILDIHGKLELLLKELSFPPAFIKKAKESMAKKLKEYLDGRTGETKKNPDLKYWAKFEEVFSRLKDINTLFNRLPIHKNQEFISIVFGEYFGYYNGSFHSFILNDVFMDKLPGLVKKKLFTLIGTEDSQVNKYKIENPGLLVNLENMLAFFAA